MPATTKRGGPATTAGKAISRHNATRHGALSEVIPVHEVAAYTRHVDLIRDHYRPRSYLEEVLTERVANILWRMARVARYEQAVIKRNVDHALRRDGITSVDELIADLDELAARSDPYAEDLIQDTKAYLQQTVALAALPADLADKVPRYEAHLDRSLQRSLSQLKEMRNMEDEFVSQFTPSKHAGHGRGKGHG